MTYSRHIAHRSTPQSQPLFGKQQVRNSAGGYVFQLDSFKRLERFLILGCEGGTYYADERKLTIESAQCVLDCIKADPAKTVQTIVSISESGRAAKNDPAVFALALCAASDNILARQLALQSLRKVCRIGTHLFQFVEAVDGLRGWGRTLRQGVANWYLQQTPTGLAMQVTKYAQRKGWSHRDVLRLCHAKTTDEYINNVLQYAAQPEKWREQSLSRGVSVPLLEAVEAVKKCPPKAVPKLIRDFGLVWEHIPTEHLKSPEVWEALLEHMPITATIRNLARMTSIGLIKPLSKATKTVVDRITNPEELKRGRVHPFSLLLAIKTYATGHGFRGSLTWTAVPQVQKALEDAFYLAFGTVQPTGRNWLFGIDVSGSMDAAINNTNVSCRSAAACMAMVSYRTEPNSYAFGFTSHFEDLGLTANMSLAEVEKRVYNHNFGSTDCAVPMRHATREKLEVDAFVVLTDNETWAGRSHPMAALKEYRQKMGRPAKLIVVGMTDTEFTIGDPDDGGCLDVVGFDANAPRIMADFVSH